MTAASDFAERGFVHLPAFFNREGLEYLDNAEATIRDLYAMQARKCGYTGRWPELLDEMEAADKEALYQVQKMLPSSHVRRVVDLIGGGLLPYREEAYGCELIEGPGLFINRPGTDRLLYRWHSEAHYYPKRRRFVNVWIPLFGDKTKANGAMSFKVGSHKRDFPFAEYQGYDRASLGRPNHFVQYEIPDSFLTEYEDHVCEAQRGDVILFDRALVHRSNRNTTDQYSFALVARIWDASDDLTIAGDMAAKPYGGDIGRPGLIVRP